MNVSRLLEGISFLVCTLWKYTLSIKKCIHLYVGIYVDMLRNNHIGFYFIQTYLNCRVLFNILWDLAMEIFQK
jgi:hypothetical protein